MSKHKPMPKETRLHLYNKYNQKCAYCGNPITYKEMQIDHIKSVYVNSDTNQNMNEEELYNTANLLPSCRQCNFYKSTFGLDEFRNRLTTTLIDNLKKQFNYKLALKYELITENIKPVEFYFEQLQRGEDDYRNQNLQNHTIKQNRFSKILPTSRQHNNRNITQGI